MSQQFFPETPSSFAPESFTVPQNHIVSDYEVLQRQMRYEAAMSEVKGHLVILGGTILAALYFLVPAVSNGVQDACQSDKLPAVVCEQNQIARERAVDLYRRIVGIPEPPFDKLWE